MPSKLEEIVASINKEFCTTWSFDGRDLERPSSAETLRLLIAKQDVENQARLEHEFFQHGPLEGLLSDASIREIVINGARDIWFEKDGALHSLSDTFLSESTFKSWVEKICAEAKIKIDMAQPFADGRWRDFRIHIGCAPLTHCDFHITLRRLSNSSWTLERLRELQWASDSQLATLQSLIHDKKNILFIGPTGSGKTTALSACLAATATNERVVVIEDTDELPRPNSASSKLLTRVSGSQSLPEVTLADLVRQSLRMRPMRLVLGEVRGGEAKDLLLALATGHAGSLGTIHAQDAKQALLRLEMLVQLGAPQWNVQAIRQLIQLSVETLVVCGFNGKERRLLGIYRVAALESFGFLLEPLH